MAALLLQTDPILDAAKIRGKLAYRERSAIKYHQNVWGSGLVDLGQMRPYRRFSERNDDEDPLAFRFCSHPGLSGRERYDQDRLRRSGVLRVTDTHDLPEGERLS
ncbi:hypothetical protein [Actinopolyspora xinjiangensis]|uniref:hypothetical protein n=1 Tax=Actinopolyspora xinjiangensis TaxID=405564 RepID=UPI003CC7A0EE